ncbi:DUF1223 domain-containing protein [Roseisalinus antarcticus]|uniref:DUF1223 domain-containing protein n=1 Tax=Roseisalinus antarcticus TaxID=254357 RepID=A0A1Y5T902_9RHOB|nr:DUF1223 domain-containing protein [Roseisalinus antarcticus]SLN54962.1 hypothetical protein ROA7023_02486 [Roseisalinus antarcticus]
MRHALSAAVLSLALGAGAALADTPKVVVELFTSQGCSSCPPADAMLRDLAQRDDVIALALHVDYWDYIGWADIFASPAFTERQKAYARAAGERMVYTPQMIIGGVDPVVGTRPMQVADLLRAHSEVARSVSLGLRATGDEVEITAEGEGDWADCIVQLVRYLPERTVEIDRGENAGRTLVYANVVTSWEVVGEWDGQGTFSLTVPRGDQPLAVIVQREGHGAILAAAALD